MGLTRRNETCRPGGAASSLADTADSAVWRAGGATRRRGIVRGLAAAATTAALVSGMSVVASPAEAARSGMYFGGYSQVTGSETMQQAYTNLERMAGADLGAARVYMQWSSAFPQPFHNWLKSDGKTIILSIRGPKWGALASAQPGSTLYSQAAQWGKRLRDFKAPIYVAFHHEPEARESDGYGTASQYQAAFRRFVTIVRSQGATNVKPMVILTGYGMSLAGTSDPRASNKWYPGDSYVSAIGVDVYNWYNCRGDNVGWRSLATLIEPARKFGLAHPGEEMWLPEFGSAEDRSRPGRKAAWIDEARQTLKQSKYSQFFGATWYDSTTKCDWRPDTTSSSRSSFSTMAKDSFYR